MRLAVVPFFVPYCFPFRGLSTAVCYGRFSSVSASAEVLSVIPRMIPGMQLLDLIADGGRNRVKAGAGFCHIKALYQINI